MWSPKNPSPQVAEKNKSFERSIKTCLVPNSVKNKTNHGKATIHRSALLLANTEKHDVARLCASKCILNRRTENAKTTPADRALALSPASMYKKNIEQGLKQSLPGRIGKQRSNGRRHPIFGLPCCLATTHPTLEGLQKARVLRVTWLLRR